MIRKFKVEDINQIEFNQFIDLDCFGITLNEYANIIDKMNSYTLIHNDKIQCILFMAKYADGIYSAGILFSKDFELVCAREVKRFINDHIIPTFNIRRLETESVDCDLLNRWHEFLGFTPEGVKRKYLNGNDYKIWSIV